ncbi:SRPBCC family protein [Niabella hirudinis]|uniref:SRPBCC family protein n=1 Tax=Niabella hirudinis TaxID=1285929 RepID=UPI003EB8A25B
MQQKTAKDDSALRQAVEITHVFNAEAARVFEAWTNPEQLVQWYAPDGCSIRFKTIDVREGGSFHSCIHSTVHGDCWCKGHYLEITAPRQLVFTLVVTNENGEDITAEAAGMAPDWPVMTTVTVTFEPLGNKTRILLRQTVPAALAQKTGALPSWILMFNRLKQLL